MLNACEEKQSADSQSQDFQIAGQFSSPFFFLQEAAYFFLFYDFEF